MVKIQGSRPDTLGGMSYEIADVPDDWAKEAILAAIGSGQWYEVRINGDYIDYGIDIDRYEQIVSLINNNRKIEAIKKYREWSGVGLKEAKQVVDRIDDKIKPKPF